MERYRQPKPQREVNYAGNACWHECPRCHKEWCHEAQGISLDPYFRVCPACKTDRAYRDGPVHTPPK